MSLRDDLATALAGERIVIGIGVDIEEIARFELPRDLRLLDVPERALCAQRASAVEFVAGRWCAKEAVVKALAACVPIGVRDASILEMTDGRPRVVLPRELEEAGISVAISISHTATVASAFALAQWSRAG